MLSPPEQAEFQKLEHLYARLGLYAWWLRDVPTGLENVPTSALQAAAERAIAASEAGPLTAKQEEFLPRLRKELALRRAHER